ncbi:MAG: monofunctional biosynthetic peptidoglycan transglycosylase [Plesiomonas sp.]|uniref:monofunctional biosynthetic peptidoglycan transglycosylase n=1 Tax=Plesiomonas sp. TaxID=2486279 RepID=UPI003F34BC6C
MSGQQRVLKTDWQRWKQGCIRIFAGGLSVLLSSVIVYSVLPVALPSVIIERVITAHLEGKPTYSVTHWWVASDAISPQMKLAVIAAEDQRFPDNFGFDFQAIAQALKHNEHSRRIRGGSTISQQTAKNVFLWSDRSWLRKGLEAGVTVLIELFWSKDRILTVYLNSIEFGQGIFGVEAAARHYFHKSANQLTATESARLAAVLPNPIRYQVQAPSAYVLQRQKWILRQMRQLGGVTAVNML